MRTVASAPTATGGSSVTLSRNAAASVSNRCGLPSRSTRETARSAASSDSVESGERRATNVTVAAPEIDCFAMSNASSAL